MDLITVIVKNLHNQGIVRGKPFKQKDSLRRKVNKLMTRQVELLINWSCDTI